MRWLFPLLALLHAPLAQAVNLTCTLPNSLITRAQELCEDLRKDMLVRPSEWNNNICASQMLRLGLIQANRIDARRDAQILADTSVDSTIAAFDPAWPPPTQAKCGDSTRDAGVPFNEQCDDGNNAFCDGCSSTCRTETGCGDGSKCGLEACDDGNVVNGDGCSSLCQVE